MVYHDALMNRIRLFSSLSLCLVVGACSGATTKPSAPAAASASAPGPATPVASSGPPASSPPPSHPLTIPEARRYMLALINRDRASQNLPPVDLDEGPPTKAAQAHAEDMAHLGYLGHWGSDGSVPEQRHTEAGGVHMVLENAVGFIDETKRTLDPNARIDPRQIEKAQASMFDELPPNDGHRQNILRPLHNKVGIGIAQPVSTPTEIATPCFAQEFVDAYGTYAPISKRAKADSPLHVEGTLVDVAEPTGVGIARLANQSPLPPAELNKRRSYPVPKPQTMYWRPGFVTPIPVKIQGKTFSIDIPLPSQTGLYEVSVWARVSGKKEDSLVSLRTFEVF